MSANRNINALARLKRLYELPPKDVLRKVARRVRGQNGVDIAEILASPKHMRHQRVYDMLSRYETILARAIGWPALDFAGRRVLELGCGPMLGWAPLALFCGAERVVAVDPEWEPAVLRHPLVAKRYLGGLFKDLSAVYGPRVSFEDFREGIATRCEAIPATLLEARLEGPFDIVLSNSCLEHIVPLDRSLQRLAEISAPDCRFLHLVDFGNHRATRNPFDDIYDRDPETYASTFGTHINLLRGPDMLRLFEAAGLPAVLVPYYSQADDYDGGIAACWRDTFSDEELFLKAALIASPA